MLRIPPRTKRRDGHFSSDALPDVDASQWWGPDRIAAYQAERLRLIVAFAYDESPFYRDWMRRHGVRPSTIQGPDDLGAIPPVDRAAVAANRDRIIVPSMVHEHALSGGTTGHRLRWARTVPWLELFTACLWRGFGWAGLRPDMKLVGFYSRMGMVAERRLVIEKGFELDTVEDDIAMIRSFEPDAAYVYASAAHLLARYLLATGRTLPLSTIITSCETLYEEHRAAIESAFGCPVFDNYGCNDGGAWGAECGEHRGLHQDVERSIVEFMDGRMVTTDLWNTAFPFIRYENGDAGRWVDVPCACGRGSPRFQVIGRVSDLLVTPMHVLFPSTLNYAFLKESVADARVVQRSEREVEAFVVRADGATQIEMATLEAELRELFEGMELSLRFVDRIPPTLSGKHRVGINLSGIEPPTLVPSAPAPV